MNKLFTALVLVYVFCIVLALLVVSSFIKPTAEAVSGPIIDIKAETTR